MVAIYLILYGLAVLFFGAAAFIRPVERSVILISAGLVSVSLAWFVQTLQGVTG